MIIMRRGDFMSVILWLIVAFVAGVVEAVTVALVSVWLAIGAVCAAVAAWLGASSGVQCVVFAAVSLVLLVLTAPLCSKFRVQKKIPTNADMLIGSVGIVTEEIDPMHGRGEVKVGGQRWSAQTRDASRVAEGETVTVEEIVGAHVVVSVNKDKED